jgi:plasmid stabilization system protein ParE
MGFKIIWTIPALNSFQQNIDYLNENWTEKEVFAFTEKVNDILHLIREQPELFRKSSKYKNVHRAVVMKQITLVYQVKPRKREIELLIFWDNRKNPAKDNYK